MRDQSFLAVMVGVALLWAPSGAGAITPAEKCESSKLKEAGKYGFCRLNAESKAVKTASTPDYSKCDAKYGTKWPSIESGGGGMCPSNGDQMAIKSFITQHTDDLAAALAGGPLPVCSAGGVPKTGQTSAYGPGSDGDLQKGAARSFTDNGDGTITDNLTGLMWEKKGDDGTIHDKDNTYTWGLTSSPYTMNGTMVTTFLAGLNGGGGFAGHTDWRIPNITELQSIANYQNAAPLVSSEFNTSCATTCTVTTCSCTQSNTYWSSSTSPDAADNAWFVSFSNGFVLNDPKSSSLSARAVRGGS